MKILFALSQIEITGAEVYAVTLAHALKKLGHEIVFVSDKIQSPIPFKFYSLPIHSKNSSYLGRVKNIFSLKKIIRQENIQLIHSHSRAANLVCHFAKGNIPMIVTVHGRWRSHFAARALPCLGNKTVAVCPYLERYLVEEIKRPKECISMIPNGLDTDSFKPAREELGTVAAATVPNSSNEILFVGRFSGQKGAVIRYLLREIMPFILKDHPSANFRIISSGATSEDLSLMDGINKRLSRKGVLYSEDGRDLVSSYQKASFVIGSGRVALEGMACGKAVIAVGESSAPGILSPENIDSAFDSNFGDCGIWNLFLKENNLLEDISKLLSDANKRKALGLWGRELIQERFDVRTVADQIDKIVRSYVTN